MVVGDWANRVTENSLHSPYNLHYVRVVMSNLMLNCLGPLLSSATLESNSFQSNNSKRVTSFITRFDLISQTADVH